MRILFHQDKVASAVNMFILHRNHRTIFVGYSNSGNLDRVGLFMVFLLPSHDLVISLRIRPLKTRIRKGPTSGDVDFVLRIPWNPAFNVEVEDFQIWSILLCRGEES